MLSYVTKPYAGAWVTHESRDLSIGKKNEAAQAYRGNKAKVRYVLYRVAATNSSVM